MKWRELFRIIISHFSRFFSFFSFCFELSIPPRTSPSPICSGAGSPIPPPLLAKMMHMTFYWGRKVTILFDSWQTKTWTGYILSLVALFLVAAFYQYMEDRRVRFKILARSKTSPPPAIAAPLLGPAPFSGRFGAPARYASAILFGVNSAIGYLLMLAVMSFNAGVFISIVVGLAFGYLLFRSSGEEDLVMVENPCACA